MMNLTNHHKIAIFNKRKITFQYVRRIGMDIEGQNNWEIELEMILDLLPNIFKI